MVGYILAFTAATLMLTVGGYTVTAPGSGGGLGCPGCIWPGRAIRQPMSGSGQEAFYLLHSDIFMLSLMMSIDFTTRSRPNCF